MITHGNQIQIFSGNSNRPLAEKIANKLNIELAGIEDVGKYTGYYYAASMAAQAITPVLSGAFLTYVGMETFFPYAAIFVFLAFITMLFVTHGDSIPTAKKSVLEHLDVD